MTKQPESNEHPASCSEDKMRRFATVVRDSNDAITIQDFKGQITAWNHGAELMYGYSEEQALRMNINHLTPPGKEAEQNEFTRRLIAGEIITSLETQRVTKDGRVLDVWLTVTKLVDETGKPIGIASTERDITKRKKAENEMRKFSNVVQQTADIVIITDKDGVIEYTNPAFEQLIGYNEKEVIGKTPRIIKSGSHDNEFYEKLWKTILSGEVFRDNLINRKKNGELYYEKKTITPILDAKGHITHFVSIGKDITENKKLQDQLFQSQKMEAIGTLAGGMAHDFRNVLTVIQGYVSLSLMDLDKENPVTEYLKNIAQASKKAADLTQQLLIFGRQQPMNISALNLQQTVHDLLKMLKRLIGENIAVKTKLAPDTWGVKADRSNMEQVIMNLVVNARDAMPKGGEITIKAENVTIDSEYCLLNISARPGKFVLLSVADTGTGMDKETIQRIFEPFFTTKEEGKGTGLGLAVVYGIVKQHQGWINVYSEPGQGATFKIYLPAFTPISGTACGLAGRIENKPEKPVAAVSLEGNKERVLLVEDEETVREFAHKVLEKHNYVVFAAATAREAEEIFDREKGDFQLVFSDTILPDAGGLELVHRLRTRNPKLPILLSSGYANEKVQKEIMRQKRMPFIQKPYTIDNLLKIMRESIAKGK
ncbi:MAG: PAS domain S-box protein [Planctomycetota bacterium]